ncbi:MAG: hypothetical protein L7V86_02590, partial [Verrucomicrobiales bacterium]|nr:hypothetical protein [Verrucomicrobiales bacterium]
GIDTVSNLKTECLDWCYLEKQPAEAASSHRSMKCTHIVSLIFGSVVLLVTLASAQGQTPGTQNAALEQKIEDLKVDIEFIGEGEGLIEPLIQLGSAYKALG